MRTATPPMPEDEVAAWQAHAAWLASTTLEFARNVVPNSGGALYGSLPADALVDAISAQRPALRLHKDAVQLPDRIKTAGAHTVELALPLPANAPDTLPRTVRVAVRVVPAADA